MLFVLNTSSHRVVSDSPKPNSLSRVAISRPSVQTLILQVVFLSRNNSYSLQNGMFVRRTSAGANFILSIIQYLPRPACGRVGS